MKTLRFCLLLGAGLLWCATIFAQEPPTIITMYEDDFEGDIASGWDIDARSHTLTQADGYLTIAVDKPTDAEKWDGVTMGFGSDTLLDLTESGWFSVDLKADADCTVDISLFDTTGAYNPGKNKLDLTGGADWVTMEFLYAGEDLFRVKWDGTILDTVDAAILNKLLMTFNGGSAWTGNVMMDNMKIGFINSITSFEDDFVEDLWIGWDTSARSHTLTQSDGMLQIAVDKPSDAEKWDGVTMGFGAGTLLDLTNNGWFTVDLKADDDCTVDISVMDSAGVYNPGNNQIDLTGGEDWVTMEFNFIGENLVKYKWDGTILDTVDASIIHHLLMTFNGGSAWTGNVLMDNLSIGVGSPPDTADITFIVDDSDGQAHTALAIKGSWGTESGKYDADWSGGDEHSDFYDDGTHGDETADDHIWTVTLKLIPDGGENTWEWGVNDADGEWIDGNFQFTVEDATPQTLDPFVILGISRSLENSKYSVYPNPANDRLFVDNARGIYRAELINLNGQVVQSVSNNKAGKLELFIDDVEPGVYLLRMSEKEGNYVYEKVMVQ